MNGSNEPTKDQVRALEWVVRDLHSEAHLLAPVGLADPAEISQRDMAQAEALTDYANKLKMRINRARHEKQSIR
jgi:hypothetical protein